MHAIMYYHVPSLFSARTLATNAFAARTLLCPTPAMLKMGILATLLRRDQGANGQEHLEWLAPLPVAWAPPPSLAVTAATVRVWKGEQLDQPLKMLAGLREYVHMEQPFGIALGDVPVEHQADLEHGLTHLRALGNAESIVQPIEPVQWSDDLPEEFVSLNEPGDVPGDIAAVLDDLGSDPQFERLSVYRQTGGASVPRLGEDRVRVLLQLPLQIRRRTADGYVVERVS